MSLVSLLSLWKFAAKPRKRGSAFCLACLPETKAALCDPKLAFGDAATDFRLRCSSVRRWVSSRSGTPKPCLPPHTWVPVATI